VCGQTIILEQIWDCLDLSSLAEAAEFWYNLLDKMGIEHRLSVITLDVQSTIELILGSANPDRLSNFPLVMNENVLRDILEKFI